MPGLLSIASARPIARDEDPLPLARSCGSCTMCCKLVEVPDLGKPAGRRCQHAVVGVGCGKYDERPTQCRTFQCLWLLSEWQEEMRPDQIKAVLWVTTGGDVLGDASRSVTYLVVCIDPSTPDIYLRGALGRLVVRMRLTYDVIVVCGARRTVLPKEGRRA
jgi:hypothetical protein